MNTGWISTKVEILYRNQTSLVDKYGALIYKSRNLISKSDTDNYHTDLFAIYKSRNLISKSDQQINQQTTRIYKSRNLISKSDKSDK